MNLNEVVDLLKIIGLTLLFMWLLNFVRTGGRIPGWYGVTKHKRHWWKRNKKK